MFDLFKSKKSSEEKEAINVKNINKDNIKNDGSKAYDDIIDIFKNFRLSEFMLRVVNSKLSFEELNGLFSEDIDKIIINGKNEGLKFIGGIFKIIKKDEKIFRVSFQLYFKTKTGKFLTKASESDDMLIEYLTEEAHKELNDNKVIEFEINEPK